MYHCVCMHRVMAPAPMPTPTPTPLAPGVAGGVRSLLSVRWRAGDLPRTPGPDSAVPSLQRVQAPASCASRWRPGGWPAGIAFSLHDQEGHDPSRIAPQYMTTYKSSPDHLGGGRRGGGNGGRVGGLNES